MHIAIDARIINTSTGRYVERLLSYLEELDSKHTYSVLVRKKDRLYWEPTKPNFRVVVADYADYSFGEQLGFAKFLYKLNPDLVHFCMPQQPLLYRGRCVTTVHDLNLLRIQDNDMNPAVLKVKKRIFRQLLRNVAKRSKYVITPTNYTKKDLIEFQPIPSSKVVVTPEASEKFDVKPEPVEKYKNLDFIMYVGQSSPYKNNRALIEAHQTLLFKNPDLQLIIVGKKDKQRTDDIRWVSENEYRNVHFTGFMSDAQLAWLYKNCKAYVFPSYMEGFGLPPLEAMQYGAPVVSSNATCLPEVLGDAAHYFDPSKTDEIADAIQEVLENKKLRDRLVSKGYERIKKYSWKKMAKQTLAIYNDALKDN